MVCLDSIATPKGSSLSDMTVVRPREPRPLQSSMAKGWLEGSLCLMSPCYEGDGGSQQLLTALWTWTGFGLDWYTLRGPL